MTQPAYHLRTNKAIDRLAMIEAIRRLERIVGDLSSYTYYGFGGPYLEDFRLLYELCPALKLVSFEKNADVRARQRFHLPCGTVQLEPTAFRTFVAQYQATDQASIVWLDNTGLEYAAFGDFIAILAKVSDMSMIKITLRAQPKDYAGTATETPVAAANRFRAQFGAVMPDSTATPPTTEPGYSALLVRLLEIAAQQALPSSSERTFLPVSSFRYSDGTPMVTVTGLVTRKSAIADIKKVFGGWQFTNHTWAGPRLIDVPTLSTKERLHLQKHLPHSGTDAGKMLRGALGHLIDDTISRTEAGLQQYADYHSYFPYFVRAIP